MQESGHGREKETTAQSDVVGGRGMGRGERWGSAQRTPANETHHGMRSAQAEAMKPPNRGKGAATAEARETAAQCEIAATAAKMKPRHKVK